MVKETIYQHFKKEERAFIVHIADVIERCETSYAYQLTSFLTPRQVEIVKNLSAQAGLNCYVSSDWIPSEYARCLVTPDYYVLNLNDFELALVEVRYNAKFNQLQHRQIMGSLLAQLGIKRQVLGDILVNQQRAQFFIDRQMLEHALRTVNKVASVGIRLEEVPLAERIQPDEERKEQFVLVSSMRLDTVIATTFSLSRTAVAKLVTSGLVKVNYGIIEDNAHTLSFEDLVSVRGFGRFRLKENIGFSKSGKHKLLIERVKHK